MSVQVDYFSTSKFFIREDQIENLKRIVELLKDESNVGCGYYSSDHYIDLTSHGNNAFSIRTGGYCDGGPELRSSVLYGFKHEEYETEEEQDEYNGSISIFQEIQEMLEKDNWFFVDSVGFEKNRIYSSTIFYHANGKTAHSSAWDIKKNILSKFGIKDEL